MDRNIKVGESATVYFTVLSTDNITPAVNEAGGQPQTLINAGSFTTNGISTLTSQGYGRYSATLDTSSLSVTPGDIIRTRYKGAVTAESIGDTFLVIEDDTIIPPDAISISYYGSVDSADLFFSNRLNVRAWTDATIDDKKKSLIMATQIIDRLNFAGAKANDGQVLQFPRKNTYTAPTTTITTETADIYVPIEIKYATYLVAYRLLDGYDPEFEARNLAISSNKIGSLQTNYNRDYIPEYLLAGVPSVEAWNYLRPFLRDPLEVSLLRV